MTSPITIYFLGVAPIPVGHRVEVRTYFIETGVFRKKLEPNFDQPILTDLDTGIVYSAATNYAQISMYTPGARLSLPLKPRADLKLHGLWTATVRACNIHWIGVGSSAFPQTTLVVDPQTPA